MPGGETSCSAQFRYGLTRSNVDPRVRVLCRKIDDRIWPSLQDGPKKSWRSTWSFSLHHIFAPHIFWNYLRPRGGNVLLRCDPQVIYMTCHKSLVACGVLGKNDMMILWCIDVVEPSMPFLDWMIIFNPQPVLLWPNLNGGGGRWERACILWGGSRSSKGSFFFLPFLV